MTPPPPLYLDGNAARAVLPAAFAAFVEASGRRRPRRQTLAAARARLAACLGAADDEVLFLGGGSEANACALYAACQGVVAPRLVVGALEHSAVSASAAAAAAAAGGEIAWARADGGGQVGLAAIAAAAAGGARQVALMLAHNETGVLQPVAEVARWCRPRAILVHSDAVQAAGWVDLDVADLGVDTLALAGHKVGAVGGIGALFARRGAPRRPPWRTVDEDPGLSAPAALSMAVALEARCRARAAACAAAAASRDALEAALQAQVPGCRIIGRDHPRLPHVTLAWLPGCAADALLIALDLDGIAVSAGSACSAGVPAPSSSLLAMGVPPAAAAEVLRISPPEPLDPRARAQVVARIAHHAARARRLVGARLP